jgi:putative ABC transport system permease protein
LHRPLGLSLANIERTWDALRLDARQALRRLRRDWQFTSGAVVILALGIGANTAVFSLLNNGLLRPLPFAERNRLVNIYQNDAATGEPEGVSYPAFLDLQRETEVFTGVAASRLDGVRYQTVDSENGRRSAVRSAPVEYARANYLDVMGLRPSLGRWFTIDEERRGEPVAVLGWSVWQQDFAADPNILGQTLIAGGSQVQVIGVGPKELNSMISNFLVVSLWMPVQPVSRAWAGNAAATLEDRTNLGLQVRARLRPGVPIEQARAALEVVAQRWAADHPDTESRRGITVLATNDVYIHPREKFVKPLAVAAMTVVGLVLAIACSNLATLLLVRSSARYAEISVRLALGATRWQLVRHLLVESLLLSTLGAGFGVAIAHWGLRYLSTIDLPLILSMQLDYRVLGFAIAAAVLCGVGFGLTPALQTTRIDVAGTLREEKGSSGSALSLTRSWFTLKNLLVIGQVAASFLLLVGAVLALSVLTATQSRSVGFRPQGLAMVEVDPRYAGYDTPRAAVVFDNVRRHIAALPGVESAFIATGLSGSAHFDQEVIPDGAKPGESSVIEGAWAEPGYFEGLGIPLLFGRTFDQRDTPGSPQAILVSEALARSFFGNPNAVGKRLKFADQPGAQPAEIVGVVGNTRSIDMVADAPHRLLYRSAAQAGKMPTSIVARTSQNAAQLLGRMQQEIRRLHPEIPVVSATTMEQHQAMELMPFRIALVSLATLGGLGLLLAAIGLYAVVAYAVAQRTNELGIRIALGARPGDVTRLVVRDVTALVIAGIALGSALSWAGVTLLESSFQILGVNPWALLPVTLLIVASGAAAAYAPARRAVLTDPITAIRHQ